MQVPFWLFLKWMPAIGIFASETTLFCPTAMFCSSKKRTLKSNLCRCFLSLTGQRKLLQPNGESTKPNRKTFLKYFRKVWTSNWKRLTPCAAQSWRLSSSFLLQPVHGLLCLLPILFLQRKHKKTKSLPEGLRKKSSRKWKKSFLRRGNPWLIQPGCWTIVETAFSRW